MTTTTMNAWLRRAVWLVTFTIIYNLLEAGVALWSGIQAGSIALVGFGLDSLIELAAASLLFWRLRLQLNGTLNKEQLDATEDKVHKFVGVTFFLLAAYVLIQSAWTLWKQDAAEESMIGIVLAVASLIIMPVLAWGKLRAAAVLHSGALRAEAKETLACTYLSFTLLLGLVLNAWLGWWWADPVAALLMVPWLIKEGREGFEEDGCGCHDD
jgi:divalent metal cation (Fe/Co/Zn/Cd) transporter